MTHHQNRPSPSDQQWYRRVMGQFPTGVTLITASDDGQPVGMVVGSFASVSLDPPLVSFYPAKTSTTWPKIEAAGSFCVNILGADQEMLCRAFMAKSQDVFLENAWSRSEATSSPALEDAIAWIDCRISSVTDAGDHWLVTGEVMDMDIGRPGMPMLFFRGGYGRFDGASRVATELESGSRLRALNAIRHGIEGLAAEYQAECVVAAIIRDEMVLLASAGEARGVGLPSRVGERVPARAPIGRSLLAWASDAEAQSWLQTADAEARETIARSLDLIRERGYSVTVASEAGPHADPTPGALSLSSVLDPGEEWVSPGAPSAATSVSVPVLDVEGRALFAIALYGIGQVHDLSAVVRDLRNVASSATDTVA